MSDLISNIFQIKKSKPYIDYKNYHRGNIFGVTKMSRRELMHSNFIAWALDPDSSHALRFYPLYQLIRSLGIIQGNADNFKARKIDSTYSDPILLYEFFNDDFIVNAKVFREHPVPIGGKNKYIDILIEISTKEKILPVIIENKVESKENGPDKDQTKIYFDWGEKQYSDTSKYFTPIYIYLYPEYNSEMQKAEEYIRMTYQELVDYILDPSLAKCGDLVSINNYKVYLQCLSFQSDNEKGENTMAISNEEKEIFRAFIRENEELLCAVLDQLGELVDVDKDSLTAVTSSIRDNTLYEFNKQTYRKGRLVLAVVQQYVADKNPADFKELQKAFPAKLRGGSGVVQLSSDVSAKDKGIGGKKRYFVKSKEVIKLSSGEEVLVSDQWGGADKMDKFIEYINTVLGYTITKV